MPFVDKNNIVFINCNESNLEFLEFYICSFGSTSMLVLEVKSEFSLDCK